MLLNAHCECAAVLWPAFDGNVSAVGSSQASGNRQAQAGSAGSAGHRHVDLMEFFKDFFLRFRCNADAVVFDGKSYLSSAASDMHADAGSGVAVANGIGQTD